MSVMWTVTLTVACVQSTSSISRHSVLQDLCTETERGGYRERERGGGLRGRVGKRRGKEGRRREGERVREGDRKT